MKLLQAVLPQEASNLISFEISSVIIRPNVMVGLVPAVGVRNAAFDMGNEPVSCQHQVQAGLCDEGDELDVSKGAEEGDRRRYAAVVLAVRFGVTTSSEVVGVAANVGEGTKLARGQLDGVVNLDLE